MTRQEFIDDVTCWSELMDFCSEEDCDICSDIYDEDYRDECIEDRLVDWARNNNWRELCDMLNRLADNNGYDWYVYDDYYDTWEPATDDEFDDRRDRVVEWMDANGYWDDDEDEEEEEEDFVVEEPVDPEDITPTPDEDCSIMDMFSAGIGCVRSVAAAEIERARQADRDFAELAGMFGK